jgi:hypothetical protein
MVSIAPVRQLGTSRTAVEAASRRTKFGKQTSHSSRPSAALKVPSELHTALPKNFYKDGIFKLVLTCEENASLCMGVKFTSSDTAVKYMSYM